MNPARTIFRAVKALPALLIALPVLASGRIALPPVAQTFSSHAACADEIERLAQGDARQVSARITFAETMREVTLETRGVQRLAAERLRYEATIWHHNGVLLQGIGQYEIHHSFEKLIRECEGATLRITGEKGFTLSTFEPMAERR